MSRTTAKRRKTNREYGGGGMKKESKIEKMLDVNDTKRKKRKRNA